MIINDDISTICMMIMAITEIVFSDTISANLGYLTFSTVYTL